MSTPKSLHRDYPLLRHCTADPRLMGFPAILNPFLEKTSASRIDMMMASAQAMVVHGCDFPGIYTGFEHEAGQYEFSSSARDQDVTILEIIPKYIRQHGPSSAIRANPYDIVIYRGLRDGKIGYFKIESHFGGSDGFGYRNQIINRHRVQVGEPLEQGVKLTTSPAHRGEKYCLGFDANIAYMPLDETIEDAMLISESMAAKMTTTAVGKLVIPIPPNVIPVNLYGTEEEPRFFPDVGSFVNESNLLCAFRQVSGDTYAADADPESLRRVDWISDFLYTMAEGTQIVDIDIFQGTSKKLNYTHYAQAYDYVDALGDFYRKIVEAYHRHTRNGTKEGIPITEAFSTLVSTCMVRLASRGGNVPGWKNFRDRFALQGTGRRPIEFLQLEITYAYERKVNLGAKICGRAGDVIVSLG